MKFICGSYSVLINVLYRLFCILFKEKDKIVFISRQSDSLSEDFCLVQKKLSDYQIKTILMFDDASKLAKLKLILLSIKSTYDLATCRVCVLESYWPTVSLLKDKQFKVIQMWHSIGKIKQSGYQTLDKPSGHSGKLARLLRMHYNYDAVIAGSEFWNVYYCQTFGIDEAIIKNYGLPRVDSIINNNKFRQKIFAKHYPELLKKPIILYAPTFRKGYAFDYGQIIKYIDYSRYNLIIRLHKKTNYKFKEKNFFSCDELSTHTLISAADYVISDYSAVSLEAALLCKKILFFIPDHKLYNQNNGLNIDIKEHYPELCFSDGQQLAQKIKGKYPQHLLEDYRNKFLPSSIGNSTEQIVALIKTYFDEG